MIKVVTITQNGQGRFQCDPGGPGTPIVGRGASVLEAVGDYALQSLLVALVTDPPAVLLETRIEVAAKRWADQLRTRTKQDNGDLMTEMMVNMVAEVQSPTESAKVEAFEAELADALSAPDVGYAGRCLSTDYGPGGLIRQAAITAGVTPDCPPFPMKTCMWIDDDKVTVSHGYSAPVVQLWPEEPEPKGE